MRKEEKGEERGVRGEYEEKSVTRVETIEGG